MIVRSLSRCSAIGRHGGRRLLSAGPLKRQYSTAPSTTSSNTASQVSALGAFTTELDKIAPRFDIQGSQIQILGSPVEFYETLKSKIRTAERRIFLSTLYIGRTEHELILVLQEALRDKPKLRLSILTDALRGTRESPDPSCASLLAPLVSEFGPERVEIRMYHTPNLTGLRKRYLPRRINEGWGLQHMKIYGVDDEIIISGANLSSDYFTNRQDRYHLFSSKAITEYFLAIQEAVASISFVLIPDARNKAGYMLAWPDSNKAPSPLSDPANYVKCTSDLLKPLLRPSPSAGNLTSNTSVYPLSQMSQLLRPDTSTELPAITSILKILSSPTMLQSRWLFTAGYFNPAPSLTQLLIDTKSAHGVVVTASPWANGFYGSRGISGMLPAAYTLLSRRFLERVENSGRSSAITLKEWRDGTVGEPGGWTYHAKGFWVTLPGDNRPGLTLVGSSNYTKRSYSLDLEANMLIVTDDEGLKGQLAEEQALLESHAKEVSIVDFINIDRRVGLKVRIAMWIVSVLGGAL